MTPAVVDSGVLYALFDTGDIWHARAIDFFQTHSHDVIVPVTTLGEVGYMVDTKLPRGAGSALADWLSRRHVQLEGLLPQDLRRMTLLMSKYEGIGFVDASVVVIAERLVISTIATTDRRHFAPIRPSHATHFTLVP